MSVQPRSNPVTRRWPQLVACAAAMLAIANLQYGWTLFAQPLTESLNASLTAVAWAFTLFVTTQTGLFPINAYLVERSSARIVVSAGALLVGVGWVGAGLANSLTALYVVYALGGIGAGAVYSACIGIAMKWFPDRRGLCVGVVAGSYGFGTALTNIPISRMIEAGGYRSAFIIFGLIQGVVVLIAAQFLSMPQPGWQPAGWEAIKARVQKKVQQSSREFTPREMLRSRTFYVLYLMMSLVTFSGLMVTAQLIPIGNAYSHNTHIVFDGITLFGGVTLFKGLTALNLTMTLNNILNGSARPFFGWVSDHLGRYDTMAGVFVLEAVAITALTLLVRHPTWFIVLYGLTFFFWGDIYSLFPAAIADIFGSKHSTTNYGIQYTAKGVGSIGGPLSAMLFIATGSWLPALTAAVICNIAAAGLAVFWLKPLVTRLMKEQSAKSEPPAEAAAAPVDRQEAANEANAATAD